MPSRARLASLGLTEWYELGNAVVVTNDIANATITPEKFSNVFTSNIRENGDAVTGNIYFTNVRAIQAFTSGNGIVIAANGLITADFSNAELTGDVDTDSLIASNAEITSNLYASGEVTLGNVTILGTVDLLGAGLDSLNANIYANVIEAGQATVGDLIVTGNLTANLNITTDDVPEGSNLYFTNDRVIAVINDPNLTTTDNISEGSNLYFTNARAIGAFTAGDGIEINANGLVVSTPNLSPSFNDLYVNGNLTVTGNLTYLEVSSLEIDDNMIYLNANSTTAHPDLGWAGNYNDGTYRHAGFFRDATDGVFKVFDEYEPEPDSSPFIDTANATFHLANIQATTFIGNVSGTVSDISNHDTDALTEGANNLYFTNIRAVGSLTGGEGIVIEANGLVVATANTSSINANTASLIDLSVSNVLTANRIEANSINAIEGIFVNDLYVQGNLDANITTALVWESGNLYFTNDRAIAAFTAGDGITIEANGLIVAEANAEPVFDDIIANTITVSNTTTNVLIVNGSGDSYLNGIANVYAIEFYGNITANIVNGEELYIKNQAGNVYGLITPVSQGGFDDLLIAGYPGHDIYLLPDDGNGRVYVDGDLEVVGNVTLNLTTDDITEGSNLYFTNTRAVGSLTGGDGITIEANGLISSFASGVAVILSSETFVGDGSNTDFTMGASVTTPESIFVLVNGVTQIPGVDYSVSNVTLSFSAAPVDSSNIEVRFIGNGEAVIDSRGYFSKSIDEAVGYAVTSISAPALTVPLNTRIILHSIYVTNIDDSLSGNVAVTASVDQYNSGSPDPNTNVYIANVLPIDHRMSVELLKKPQVLNAGDKISMRAFKNGAGANANVHAYLTYETRSDVGYFGTGVNLGDTYDHMLFDSGGNRATIENVRLANYGGDPAAATVRWTNSSNVTQAYFCYNFVVPANTTVELLENPKLIPQSGRILVSASAPNAIAVSVSGRRH